MDAPMTEPTTEPMTEPMNEQDTAPGEHASPGLFGTLWRGMAMGLAEVVPGVSGGTIALITGIYRILIESLASFGINSFALLTDFSRFIAHHRLNFLLTLAIGMGAGIVVFSQLMRYLLEFYAPVVWAFFFGVILLSVWVIGKERSRDQLVRYFPAGAIAGVALLLVQPVAGEVALWQIFVGGAIAICAWILPAVSGSYMLLVLGLYETVIVAISEFDVVTVAVLGAGCASGLLVFVRLLKWLLGRFHEQLISFLCGFMAGSLLNLWPWQAESGAIGERLLSPHAYAQLNGADALLFACLLSCAVGSFLIWQLAKFSQPSS